MSPPVRRAGRIRLDDGALLVWSVADGSRGRRWRAMSSRDGQLVESVLIEVDRDGRPTRLELTNASGLLTLHPEPTGMLHGNVVTPSGMRHIALPWGESHEIAIDRLPIAGAVTARRLAPLVGVGEGRDVDVVMVSDDLETSPATRRYDRVTATSWRIEAGEATQSMTMDVDGVPTRSDGGGEPVDWPLELQHEADHP